VIFVAVFFAMNAICKNGGVIGEAEAKAEGKPGKRPPVFPVRISTPLLQRWREMMRTIVAAFEKQLNSLYGGMPWIFPQI